MGQAISNITFWKSLFFKRKINDIAMVGLDGAGKTTILYVLKKVGVVHTIPTIGFNVEKVVVGKMTFNVWDIGGQDQIRNLWIEYINISSAIVFVIDILDTDRWRDAKTYINGIIKSSNEEGSTKRPMLILANKADNPNDKQNDVIQQKLSDFLEVSHLDHVKVAHVSAIPQEPETTTFCRLQEAFEWLSGAVPEY